MSKFIFISLTVLFFSCRKDSPVKDNDPNPDTTDTCICECTCENFPQPPELGWFYQSSGPQYKAPCFNPNNANEFVYLRTGGSGTELVRYDMVLQTEVVLCNGINITTQPQWGAQGWIVFTVLDNRIWKIYEDGTGLEQITFFESLRPAFDPTGEHFICMGAPSGISPGYRPILDLNGFLVDSVYMDYDQRIIGYPYFSKSEFFQRSFQFFSDHASPNNERVGVCYLDETDELLELNSFIYASQILDLTANDEFVFYSSYKGSVRKVNVVTMETTFFRVGCETRFYNHIDISPDGTKVLAQKVISTVLNDYEIDEQNEIWLVDISSCNEQKILGD